MAKWFYVVLSGFMWLNGFMWLSGFMWYSGFMWLKWFYVAKVAKSGEKWRKVAKSE